MTHRRLDRAADEAAIWAGRIMGTVVALVATFLLLRLVFGRAVALPGERSGLTDHEWTEGPAKLVGPPGRLGPEVVLVRSDPRAPSTVVESPPLRGEPRDERQP